VVIHHNSRKDMLKSVLNRFPFLFVRVLSSMNPKHENPYKKIYIFLAVDIYSLTSRSEIQNE